MHAQQMLIWAASPQALPLSQEALQSTPICGFCRGKGTVLSNEGLTDHFRPGQVFEPTFISAKALQPLAG